VQAIDKIILGTVQFGLHYGINNHSGKPAQDEINDILDLAYSSGIRMLDTAEAYGDSQSVIGTYHRERRHRFNVITKFSASTGNLENLAVRVKSDNSAVACQSLYGYMFHTYGDFDKYYDRYKEEIVAIKKAGLVSRFGVSVYTNTELEELLRYNTLIDFVQLPFNLLDNMNQRGKIIAAAKKQGIEIHTRSVFLQGLFFKKTGELSGKFSSLAPELKMIHELCMDQNINVEDLALNYTLRQSDIDFVLIGVETKKQLEANLRSLRIEIPESCFEAIDKITITNTDLLNPSMWNR
jgi:aryl-alcohol dehydrogenase-like predicted oxidoreductase